MPIDSNLIYKLVHSGDDNLYEQNILIVEDENDLKEQTIQGNTNEIDAEVIISLRLL